MPGGAGSLWPDMAQMWPNRLRWATTNRHGPHGPGFVPTGGAWVDRIATRTAPRSPRTVATAGGGGVTCSPRTVEAPTRPQGACRVPGSIGHPFRPCSPAMPRSTGPRLAVLPQLPCPPRLTVQTCPMSSATTCKEIEEAEAAQIVGTYIGADDTVRRDVRGAPPSTHDFDLLVGGRVIALEVTSATDEGLRDLWHSVGHWTWTEPSLAWSWGLSLRPGSRINDLHRQIASLLQVLEKAAVDSFSDSESRGTRPPNVPEALDKLRRLGVQRGSSVADQPSRIVVGVVGPSGWSDVNDLNAAIRTAIDDNTDKLRKAAADERQLFVWLDWTSHAAQAAINGVTSFGRLPAAPVFPAWLHFVWVMPRAMADSQRTRPLLRVSTDGWERLDPGYGS